MIPHRPLSVATIILCAAALASATGAAADSLSLLGDRFHVDATWQTADGHTGIGTPVSLTDATGYFWFFSPTNVEAVVKVLDACNGAAPRFWVFGAGLTNAQVTLTVTDQTTGQQKTYHNPQGRAFLPIQDTDAFATCGETRCGQGSAAELAASPRADTAAEELALVMGGGVTAKPEVYARVTADLASIRGQNPAVASLGYLPSFDPHRLELTLDAASVPAFLAGNYHAWDCLNRWYGVTEVVNANDIGGVTLRFDKVLDMPRLVADYQALPGVATVSVGYQIQFPILPPPLDSFCGRIEGANLYRYFARTSSATYTYTSQPGAAPQLVATGDPYSTDAERCLLGI